MRGFGALVGGGRLTKLRAGGRMSWTGPLEGGGDKVFDMLE